MCKCWCGIFLALRSCTCTYRETYAQHTPPRIVRRFRPPEKQCQDQRKRIVRSECAHLASTKPRICDRLRSSLVEHGSVGLVRHSHSFQVLEGMLGVGRGWPLKRHVHASCTASFQRSIIPCWLSLSHCVVVVGCPAASASSVYPLPLLFLFPLPCVGREPGNLPMLCACARCRGNGGGCLGGMISTTTPHSLSPLSDYSPESAPFPTTLHCHPVLVIPKVTPYIYTRHGCVERYCACNGVDSGNMFTITVQVNSVHIITYKGGGGGGENLPATSRIPG